MVSKLTRCTVAALVLAGLPGLASADDADAEPDAVAKAEPATAEPAEVSFVAALGAAAPLSEEALGNQRAAAKLEIQEVTINEADQDGLLAGNAAVNNRTGRNNIGDDAFVNASGVVSTIQNTGNNVLIQTSTIVNVSVEQ